MKLYIRHRNPRPSMRGGLNLDELNGKVVVTVCRKVSGSSIAITADEAREVRDWLTVWLDAGGASSDEHL